MELKDRLRELRGNRTQKQMAEILGTKPNNYNNWEHGKGMDLQTLQRIADYHGVTTDYLLGRTAFKGTQYLQFAQELGLTPEAIEGIKVIKNKSSDELRALNFLLEQEYLYDYIFAATPLNPQHSTTGNSAVDTFIGTYSLRLILRFLNYSPDSFERYFFNSNQCMPTPDMIDSITAEKIFLVALNILKSNYIQKYNLGAETHGKKT